MATLFAAREDGEKASQALFEASKPGEPEADTEAQETKRRHDQLMGCLAEERIGQADERYQMAVDEDFYDSLQWTEEDAQILMERGQAPLVYNHCKTRVNWITGTQKRTKVDFKVRPRGEEDSHGAETKSKVLKYLGDVNTIQRHRSKAFEDCVIAGLGWLEDGVNTDPSQEQIYSGSESWRNLFRDRRGRDDECKDWRYIFRERRVDTDIAQAMFSDYAKDLASESTDATTQPDWDDGIWYLGERLVNAHTASLSSTTRYGSRGAYVATANADVGRRSTTNLIEAWYRVPENVAFIKGGSQNGRRFEADNERHKWEIARGHGILQKNWSMTMRVMVCTERRVLFDGLSPYRHQRFPLIPVWCYRRRRDGAPYGAIRDVRDAQEDFNKRKSKALFILSTNQIIADMDAVQDEDELREQAAAADGVIFKKKGSSLEFREFSNEFKGNLELMQEDAQFMQVGTGVTDENMGRRTNATSGIAIDHRQEQGAVVTTGPFEQLRWAVQMQGQNQISLSEQFMTEPKVLRIVGEAGKIEWFPVNKTDPTTGETLNDVTAGQADFIVDEQDFRASYRQAMFVEMSELLGKLAPTIPGLAAALLDLLIEMGDFPNKEAMLARIRKLTGQTDPSKELTPEEVAAQQAKQEQEQEAAAMQKEAAQAALDKIKAEVAQLLSKAATNEADAVAKSVEAITKALEAAGLVVAAPAAAAGADQILEGAGFKDKGGTGLDRTGMPAVPAMPAAAGVAPQPQPLPVES
jgi:hypothetical protein